MIDAISKAMQETWATGDFSMVGASQLIVGEMLCDSMRLCAGERVLDVATGAGNTALAAARRGCEVTGIDFVPALLERGRERAAAERLKVQFAEGDAEEIPFGDAGFDAVVTTFGAMFAHDPLRTAAEMLRVCRPGGKIGMANWVPSGMVGEMFRTVAKYAPPPAEVPPPSLWGVPEVVRERFGAGVSSLRFEARKAYFRQRSPEAWVEFMKRYFGPTIRAFERCGSRAEELQSEMVDLARRYNESGNETLLAAGDYLEVVAVRA